MAHDARAVANYILDLAERDDRRLTPLQLMKLVYIAHGWYLAVKDEPLVRDTVEAWPYGPVVPSVYHAFKLFGSRPITEKANCVKLRDGRPVVVEYHMPSDPETLEVIDAVWKAYSDFTGPQLVHLTHQPGTPWHEVWDKRGGQNRRGMDIPDEIIADHFREMAGNTSDGNSE